MAGLFLDQSLFTAFDCNNIEWKFEVNVLANILVIASSCMRLGMIIGSGVLNFCSGSRLYRRRSHWENMVLNFVSATEVDYAVAEKSVLKRPNNEAIPKS